VILESFARLEKALREALQANPDNGQAPRRPTSVRAIGRRALEQGLITPAAFAALDDITVLRNIVAHAGTVDLDADRALAYAEIVRQLIISVSPT
jgi:hypothetical protein